jgi:hypothetical protein
MPVVAYTVKKVNDFLSPGRDESLVSYIPAGDGKMANLFSQCKANLTVH